jgi:hypothetical protein
LAGETKSTSVEIPEAISRKASHASQHELLKVTWSPTWEPKELMHSWASFQQMIQIYEAKQIAPPLDEGLDNLERQGLQTHHY